MIEGDFRQLNKGNSSYIIVYRGYVMSYSATSKVVLHGLCCIGIDAITNVTVHVYSSVYFSYIYLYLYTCIYIYLYYIYLYTYRYIDIYIYMYIYILFNL